MLIPAKVQAEIKFREQRRKDFIMHLDAAIEAMYECDMENSGAVLSLPIKELYTELTKT